MVPSFLSPPSKICPGSLFSRTSFPSSSLFSSYLPPLRPFLSIQPTSSSFDSPHCPSSIARPPESYQPSGLGRPMSSSVFLDQRPICRFAPPPRTCAAGGTWLGCGWGGEGDGSPRDGLELLDASTGVAWDSVPSSMLEVPLRFSWCPSLCLLPPPLTLSLYNRMCPNTLPPNGRVFSWLLRAPSSRWTRPPFRPP